MNIHPGSAVNKYDVFLPILFFDNSVDSIAISK